MGNVLILEVGETGLFRMMMRRFGRLGKVREAPQSDDVFAALGVWGLMALEGWKRIPC